LCEATASERKEAGQRSRDQNGTTCDHLLVPSDNIHSRRARRSQPRMPYRDFKGTGGMINRRPQP
jgi:hypothetical protein